VQFGGRLISKYIIIYCYGGTASTFFSSFKQSITYIQLLSSQVLTLFS